MPAHARVSTLAARLHSRSDHTARPGPTAIRQTTFTTLLVSLDKHWRTLQDIVRTDAREGQQRHGLILAQRAKELRVDDLLLHRGP